MAPTVEAQPPAVKQIVTGHFHEGPGYATWRARGTDSWLLIQTLGGAGRLGYDGGGLRAEPGGMALIRPGTRHDYGTLPAAGHWELLWAHFHPRPHWHAWLEWSEAAPGLMALALPEPVIRQKITSRFHETHRLATGALRQREDFAMNGLEETLLWCSTQSARSAHSRLDSRVRDCLDFLCGSLGARVTMAEMAMRAGMSPSRLAHLFRAQVGMTPQQFQEQQRLERARQMLELSGRSIGDIAAEVGYDNPFYFTLRFKRLTGLSPREYRKKALTTPFPRE